MTAREGAVMKSARSEETEDMNLTIEDKRSNSAIVCERRMKSSGG